MELFSIIESIPTQILTWMGLSTIMFVRYAIIAGIFFSLFYYAFATKKYHRKIQQKYPKSKKIWEEVKHSFWTALIFGFLALVITWMTDWGWTKVYTDFSSFGWAYAGFSFVALLMIHDTYFYWMHYAMHKIKPLQKFHAIHHKSHNPTPWAAMAFHPMESLAEFAFVPIAVLLLPFHPAVLAIFGVFSFVFNVIGHLGFEIYPKWWLKHPVLKWVNSSTHHNMHHKNGNGNFGFYFNFWDTIMGTNHKHYESKFDEVVNRRAVAKDRVEDAILV